MRRRPIALIAAACLAIAVSLASGCSKIGGDVNGSVTLNGKPLTSGTVTFHYSDGANVSAVIGSDGMYHMVKPPKGAVSVTVEPAEGLATGNNEAGGGSGIEMKSISGSSDAKASKVEKAAIPDKYKNSSTSGLTVTVSGSSQRFDINMVGEGQIYKNQ